MLCFYIFLMVLCTIGSYTIAVLLSDIYAVFELNCVSNLSEFVSSNFVRLKITQVGSRATATNIHKT